MANEIAGIGLDRYDSSSEFGSTGRRLRSLVPMDDVAKFPADPTTKFLGENNALSVLGQEAGHRWLAFLQFSDHNRQARAESAPRVGVTFNGTRRNVLINDVIQVMGPRQPSAAESPRIHRQAFIFVVGNGRSADPAAVAKIDRIRRA